MIIEVVGSDSDSVDGFKEVDSRADTSVIFPRIDDVFCIRIIVGIGFVLVERFGEATRERQNQGDGIGIPASPRARFFIESKPTVAVCEETNMAAKDAIQTQGVIQVGIREREKEIDLSSSKAIQRIFRQSLFLLPAFVLGLLSFFTRQIEEGIFLLAFYVGGEYVNFFLDITG